MHARPAPPPTVETGVIEGREAFPNITTGMVVENRWQGETDDGDLLIVFAGAAGGGGAVVWWSGPVMQRAAGQPARWSASRRRQNTVRCGVSPPQDSG